MILHLALRSAVLMKSARTLPVATVLSLALRRTKLDKLILFDEKHTENEVVLRTNDVFNVSPGADILQVCTRKSYLDQDVKPVQNQF